MSEGGIIVPRPECIQFDTVYPADHVIPGVVMAPEVTSADGQMGRQHHRKAVPVPLRHPVKKVLVVSLRHLPVIEIRYGYDEAFPGNLHRLGIRMFLVRVPDHIDVLGLPEHPGDFVPGRTVVVARRHDDGHLGAAPVDAHHRFGKHFLDSGRGLSGVVNVSAHNEGVRGLVPDNFFDLPQHRSLFFIPVVSVKGMAEMPVAGMDYFHIALLFTIRQIYQFRNDKKISCFSL